MGVSQWSTGKPRKIREQVRVLWGRMGTQGVHGALGVTRGIGGVRLGWRHPRKTRVVGDDKEDWG